MDPTNGVDSRQNGRSLGWDSADVTRQNNSVGALPSPYVGRGRGWGVDD